MNLREFYSKALLASVPVAADLVLHHRATLDLPDVVAKPIDEVIANLGANLAYNVSMNWMRPRDQQT